MLGANKQGEQMRSNERSFDVVKRFQAGTPPNSRCNEAICFNTAVEFSNIKYKVVDSSRIKGTMTDEFFLKKIY